MSDPCEVSTNYIVVEPASLGVASVVQNVNIILDEEASLVTNLDDNAACLVDITEENYTVQLSEEIPYTPLAKRVDIADDTLIYKGEAVVGSLTEDSVWRISRTSIIGELVLVEWSQGRASFENIWDDRHTLEYS